MKDEINIRYLDHVAIIVKDLDISAAWYEKVFGLKKYKLPKWGSFPIFMLSNKCGVALFPANERNENPVQQPNHVKIDHFAFNVDRSNFKIAQKKYDELDLKYSIKDHHYFHTIYTKDPDGHTVELTTIVVDEEEFYK